MPTQGIIYKTLSYTHPMSPKGYREGFIDLLDGLNSLDIPKTK